MVLFVLIGSVVLGAAVPNNSLEHHLTDQMVPVPGSISEKRMNELMESSGHQQYQRASVPLKDIPTPNEDIIDMIQQVDTTMILGYELNITAFGPRETGTQACRNAATYLYNEFRAMGLGVRYQNWSYYGYSGSNIEGTLPGDDPSSDEIYLICGHYDTVSVSPGADDDASGVTAVLTAAELMSHYSFNHTVRFVAFSGEEQGLLGSYKYVQEAYNHQDNIVAVLNADMIGYATTTYDGSRIKVFDDGYSAWITTFTTTVSQTYHDYIGIQVIPSGWTWGSDHNSFWDFGYNAVFYFENFETPYYHTSGDTIEHMNITYAMKNSRLTLATLAELSEIQPSNVVDPDQTVVTLTHENLPHLISCPAGDGPIYQYIKVSVKNAQGNPLPGIPSSAFVFTITPVDVTTLWYETLSCTFTAVDPVTNMNGDIRFTIKADTSIYGNITIRVTVQSIQVNDADILACKTPDYNCDGIAALDDFVVFGQDYGRIMWRSDFTGDDGLVGLGDFVIFGQHYGHQG
jgi:hypothetical protein